MVKKGDLLVELDSSKLKDSLADQEIRVLNAEANQIQSAENLEVVRNQAEADVEQAELTLRFAQMDAEKYEKGEYPQQLQQAEAEITMASEELQRASDQWDWSRRLAEDGYITRTELQADELAVKRRRLDLELAQGRRHLLVEYTHIQTVERLRSDIRQAQMALERTRRKARADIVRAESDLRARQQEYDRQKSRLDYLHDQIEKCRIFAPAAGLALYATTVRPRRWGAQPLDVGQDVSERTELIYLPITSAMMAEIRVPEASLTKIHLDLPAEVKVDALPGRRFMGRLARISPLPDSSQMWMNPDLKLYVCEVHLDNGSDELRPGMSCQVEILIQHYDDAVYVPLQSVLLVNGQPTVYVLDRRGDAQPRVVEIGLDNNRMVRIISGLEEGEQVLLTPPLPPSAVHEQAEASRGDEAPPGPPEPSNGEAAPSSPTHPRPEPERPTAVVEGGEPPRPDRQVDREIERPRPPGPAAGGAAP
jgi:HlyD family secretion protein